MTTPSSLAAWAHAALAVLESGEDSQYAIDFLRAGLECVQHEDHKESSVTGTAGIKEYYLFRIDKENMLGVLQKTEALDSYLFTHSRRKPDPDLLEQLSVLNQDKPYSGIEHDLNMNYARSRYGDDTELLINDKALALADYCTSMTSDDVSGYAIAREFVLDRYAFAQKPSTLTSYPSPSLWAETGYCQITMHGQPTSQARYLPNSSALDNYLRNSWIMQPSPALVSEISAFNDSSRSAAYELMVRNELDMSTTSVHYGKYDVSLLFCHKVAALFQFAKTRRSDNGEVNRFISFTKKDLDAVQHRN